MGERERDRRRDIEIKREKVKVCAKMAKRGCDIAEKMPQLVISLTLPLFIA